MRTGLFWLNDRQWARIEPHLPTGLTGPERDDDRRIISGIIHMLQSGARWRYCPHEYGPYTTVYNRFNRWAKRGRWCAIFEALAKPGKDAVVLSLDSTSIKAHRCASGGKGGEHNQAIGRSRGGRTTKIHARQPPNMSVQRHGPIRGRGDHDRRCCCLSRSWSLYRCLRLGLRLRSASIEHDGSGETTTLVRHADADDPYWAQVQIIVSMAGAAAESFCWVVRVMKFPTQVIEPTNDVTPTLASASTLLGKPLLESSMCLRHAVRGRH